MTRSKTFHLAIAALIGLALAASVQAQIVFTETFRSPSIPGPEGSTPCQDFGGPGTYAFPTGWLLRNVDARAPDASVAYVNDAWEVRDEFPSVLNNCVAKDNRIPPRGFRPATSGDPNGEDLRPVGYSYPETSPGSGVLGTAAPTSPPSPPTARLLTPCGSGSGWSTGTAAWLVRTISSTAMKLVYCVSRL